MECACPPTTIEERTTLSQDRSRLSRAVRRAAAASRPARRVASPTSAGSSRSPWRGWIAGAVILAAATGAGWWTLVGRAHGAPAGQMMGVHLADEGFEHVAVGSEIHYKANPPASGPHYPFPAPAGVYPSGLQTGFWVHSLEHGYIVVLYKPPVSQARILQFDGLVRSFPKSKWGNVKLVVVPYADMPAQFAYLSWDWRYQVNTFDQATLLQFYKEHVDRGREDLP
jgi:hypothetical protein